MKIRVSILVCIILNVNLGSMAASMTSSDIKQQFLDGTTATAITEQALARIGSNDHDYHAVIVSGGEAVLAAAKALDDLPQSERASLPLAAVPILIKDNIETIEWPTTAGSLALAENHTGRDADLITRLRKAGAIILGKANLSEWANFRSRHSLSGWSGVGGQTRNAHDTSRSACGSSSGSAVAVALGYVPIAIGSETDGSVICPASLNGVVGIKPTHGLISGNGIVPLAATQDTAGPIASTVRDAALALSVMIDDAHPEAEKVRQSLSSFKSLENLKDIRIGVIANTQGFDKRRDVLLDASLETLQSLGAEIIPGLRFTPYKDFSDDAFNVLLYEFKIQLNAYLASLPNKLNTLSLAALIDFNESSELELSLFDQSIFTTAQASPLTESEYQNKLAAIKKASRDDGLDALFDGHKLDVLVGITTGPAWIIDDVNGDSFHGPSITSFPAVAGNPHITVPMGDIRGLPIGLSLIGKPYDDALIAAIAAAFEDNRDNTSD